MIKIFTTKSFRRDFKKAIQSHQGAIWKIMEEIQRNGINSTMQPHRLHGKMKGYWSISVPSINNDIRLIYRRQGNNLYSTPWENMIRFIDRLDFENEKRNGQEKLARSGRSSADPGQYY